MKRKNMTPNKSYLTTSNELSLDGFLTAREESDEVERRPTGVGERQSDTDREFVEIRSQALVNSENEESSDEDEIGNYMSIDQNLGNSSRRSSGELSISDLRQIGRELDPVVSMRDNDDDDDLMVTRRRAYEEDKHAATSCTSLEYHGGNCIDSGDRSANTTGRALQLNAAGLNMPAKGCLANKDKSAQFGAKLERASTKMTSSSINSANRSSNNDNNNINNHHTCYDDDDDDDGYKGNGIHGVACRAPDKEQQERASPICRMITPTIVIKIDHNSDNNNDDDEDDNENNNFSHSPESPKLQAAISCSELASPTRFLPPPAPPPSPIASDSALDIGHRRQQLGDIGSVSSGLSQVCIVGANGSLSDNSHQRSANKEAMLEKRQMRERLRNWKRSNKIITHVRENPLSVHLDCLERFESEKLKFSEQVTTAIQSSATGDNNKFQADKQVNSNGINQREQLEGHQRERLQHYASHLSHLYKKNQDVMDNNNDFRALLYNIICYLLIQDEIVLATPSVTKMIDVIRTHLESASKYYSNAINSLSVNIFNHQQQQQTNLEAPQVDQANQQRLIDRRKGSLGSLSCTSSNSSSFNAPNLAEQMPNWRSINSPCTGNRFEPNTNQLLATAAGLDLSRRQKPADFRRISSVSYNDEQLINDLCDVDGHRNWPPSGSLSGSSSQSTGNQRRRESPWRYEELSFECKHHKQSQHQSQSQHHTSQSSLGNHSSASVNFADISLNDSGFGTICDHNEEYILSLKKGAVLRKRHSDAGAEFRSIQRPSYVSSTDDNHQLVASNQSRRKIRSSLQYDNAAVRNNRDDDDNNYDDDDFNVGGEDEDSSPILRYLANGGEPNESAFVEQVDVAGRRAELEWTLNKLINFELKYTWLTSKDTLRRAIRKIGVPNEIRGKVWLILIDQMICDRYNAANLLAEAKKTIADEEALLSGDEETQSILKQIDLDVNRTMPGHKLFDDGAEGGIKLRRILVAYSIHVNRAIAYCQGFNFIVALLLSVFDGHEERALRGFICIVDHIFPSKFYFDHYLTGARADQFLLADFICDQLIKNPSTAERKMVEGVTSSITLNWFISLFHGAVPTLTRLTILDHFMLEGVKALFRFTMAILYLAFQVTPPSSCEVFTTIRNTAKDMYDIKLLLSIVEQIKLPKDSYFAIRRSFYMVQSSFNSDQFYMQSLSNDASRQLVSNKPLSVQQLPDTKPPAMSLITAASLVAHQSFGIGGANFGHQSANFSPNQSGSSFAGPRVCVSSNRTKVCIQNIGKLGRSHIKVMDTNVKSNERSLMSPLRNCLIIGISNCGKNIHLARQSSRRNFKTFREQDLVFHIHELCTEIFDGFYLENHNLALILTHLGEIFKIDVAKCFADSQVGSTETLMLRDSHQIGDHEKVKLRLASMDVLTNLLWINVECEDTNSQPTPTTTTDHHHHHDSLAMRENLIRSRYRANNPFLNDSDYESSAQQQGEFYSARQNHQRKILIIDMITFDIFSAFTIHHSFGDITCLRTSLVAFCQLANPMSNQFSSRIIRIGPTGRYEHLLSFSDVVDFIISTPNSSRCSKQQLEVENGAKKGNERYSTIKRLITRSISMSQENDSGKGPKAGREMTLNAGTLARYYRSLTKSHSMAQCELDDNLPQLSESRISPIISAGRDANESDLATNQSGGETPIKRQQVSGIEPKGHSSLPKALVENPYRGIVTSYLGDIDEVTDTDYIPVNMAFIFRNGKIALFEFTESYAIHTRESQLDRYDYSKIIEVTKNGQDFIITILTVYDKLIKVVI